MDCCTPKSTKEKINENNGLKGGKMDKRTILWIIIALLVLAVIYAVFFKGSGTGQVVSSAGQAASSAGSGMVGGC